MRRGRIHEMRGPGHLPKENIAAHGCQYQVALAHPAHEPVELLQPLPAVSVRLVLVGGLHGLLQLVVTGLGSRLAELRRAERDEAFAEPVRHEVVPIDVGPAHHPSPLRGCR